MNKSTQLSLRPSIAPKIPKDFVTAPLWPAKKQKGARVVKLGEKIYTIGGTHPIDKNRISPALDIRHFRVLLCLLSFADKKTPSKVIILSMNELANRFAENNGGEYNRYLKELLADLADCWFSVTENGERVSYRLLDDIQVHERYPRRKDAKSAINKQQEMWLESVSLHDKFYYMLTEVAKLSRVRLDVLNGISTPIAQSIYSYIPSRAVHHTENNPFEITVTKLLDQLGEDIPIDKFRRKAKFTNKRDGRLSIIEQLDGLELINGKLRVDIAETVDKSDWKLLFWVEDVKQIDVRPKFIFNGSDSKLLNAFIAHRGTKQQFDKLMKNKTPLDGYHEGVFEIAGIDYADSEEFLIMTKAIIGEHTFNGIIAELKNDVNEGRSGIKDPAKVLNNRLMKAVNPSE